MSTDAERLIAEARELLSIRTTLAATGSTTTRSVLRELAAALAAANDQLAQLTAENERLIEANTALRRSAIANRDGRKVAEAENEAWHDDAAVMAGYTKVHTMLRMRVGDRVDHAQAFRDAALASRGE